MRDIGHGENKKTMRNRLAFDERMVFIVVSEFAIHTV